MFDLTKNISLKIVRNTDVSVRFQFDICPLNVRHLIELQELFNDEDFFAWGAVRIKASPWKIYAVVYEESGNWTNLPDHSDEIEAKVDEVINRFIFAKGGYEALKASI